MESGAFLVYGYVAAGTAATWCKNNFPKQILRCHSAAHGSVTSPPTQWGYTAFVHTKISRVISARAHVDAGTDDSGDLFGPLSECCAFLVDGYVAGGTAVTGCRRNFPKEFLYCQSAGHGSVTSPQTHRGYTTFVHTKISQVIDAFGIHMGTESFGKMEGDASCRNIAIILQDVPHDWSEDDVFDGPAVNVDDRQLQAL
eukprot:Skav208903  [mRNA]  locus=scaffold270:617306:619352:- [translate_table: standard]